MAHTFKKAGRATALLLVGSVVVPAFAEASHSLSPGVSTPAQVQKRAHLRKIVEASGASSAGNSAPVRVHRRGHRPAISEGSGILAAGAMAPAPAPDTQIMVTAQKRNERIQDVPLTIAVLNPEQLISSNRTTFKDYLLQVPGVSLEQGAPGRSIISIRGVSSTSGNPLVGFTIDDVPFGASTYLGLGNDLHPDLDPADLASIEVLQGPQGTLYGASSMGGLIKYVTRSPSLTRSSGHVELDGSAVAHGDAGFSFRTGYELPVIKNVAAIRVSGFYRREAGFIDDPSQGRTNVNDGRAYGGRISLVAHLTDRLKLHAGALYQGNESDATARVDTDVDLDPLTGPYQHRRLPGTDGYHSEVQFYNLALDQDFGFATLSSLTGYTHTDFFAPQDYTQQFGYFIPLLYEGSNVGVRFAERSRVRKISQELRLASNGTHAISYIAGLFYTYESTKLTQGVVPVDAVSGNAVPLDPALVATIPQTYAEYAAFVNLTYRFSRMFDIQAGGRISHNEQKFVETDTGMLGGAVLPGSSRGSPFTFSVSPRFRLDRGMMLYGRVSTGYRAGGPNTSPPPGIQAQFGADKTRNYEVGLKSEIPQAHLTANFSAYYIDWRNIQASMTDPTTGFSYYSNQGKANIKGGQVDFLYRPLAGLTIAGSTAYTDAEIAQNSTTGAAIYTLKGDPLPYVAKWSATGTITYRWSLSSGVKPYVSASVAYTGARHTSFVATSDLPRLTLPSFTTVDLRMGADFSRFSLTVFAKNIGDERGYVGADAIQAAGPFALTLITPRTIGMSLSAKL
ncbi:TonB-dependent receptor [Gluconacetobacter azotocaptans]|uniref:TonB-dependent receptor n=1 Tax=Gluconacetobacter azotocaptans TaxID=142834 RepID=UPI00195C9FA3|nr:TonB-dependent receptor [Gluconacetobacter azotocaptans]MBM9401070.1 TonB-dependent receptor [Gluconacetobacter azotocaptans]